jgi:Ca2+-binding EF-hand superfamily protein
MQMDFTGFLDFIIAYTSLSLSEAVQYFFSVLDLRKRGYLTRDDLLRFARTTAAAAAREHGQPIDAESVCDELIFLVRPSASGRITKSDIVEANAGRIFVPYLIDSAAMAHLDAGGVL